MSVAVKIKTGINRAKLKLLNKDKEFIRRIIKIKIKIKEITIKIFPSQIITSGIIRSGLINDK